MIAAMYDAPELANPFELPGVTPALLLEVLERGEALRDQATALDAPTRGPLQAHFEKVRALREGLVPHGWRLNNDNNYCTVVSPCGRFAIAVASGTQGTGKIHPTPETAREMGPITASKVAANKTQLLLFPSLGGPDEGESSELLTWMLLSHRVGDLVNAELSLPDGATDRNVICTWRQRYLLQPLELRPIPFRGNQSADEEPAEIDVPVQMRGS